MLEKNYTPKDFEEKIYADWENSGDFQPDMRSSSEAFSIVIPPPNVTGVLHLGHALDDTLQDILVRYNRMQGKKVLWQPGTDHAGIATQMVVERNLAKEGVSRHDLGREKFIETVWPETKLGLIPKPKHTEACGNQRYQQNRPTSDQ